MTITGSRFAGVTAVMFGTSAAFFLPSSSTSILAMAPAGAGTVDVRVTTAAGTSAAVSADQYTYSTLPTVTGLSPSTGPAVGGTTVTITGTDFTGATAVKFGTNAATSVAVVSVTSITAVAPAGTGVVDVTVTTAAGTSAAVSADQYTYNAPVVISVTSGIPHLPAGGNDVTITGTGFTGATAVMFGANAGTITSWTPTVIHATSPAGTGTVDVTVTTPLGTSAIVSADQYTYAPTVTGLSPSGGSLLGGNTVTITGTGFTAATAVNFGTPAATSVTVISDSQITAVTPAYVATSLVDVRVTTAAGQSAVSSADEYSYAPRVTAISPTTGPAAGGTTVTITGSGFTGATAVMFGATAGTIATLSDSQITVVSPAHSSGIVDVTVITAVGTSAPSLADKYTYYAAPVVASLSPSSGPAVGGTTVTITGTDFTGATAVMFGTTAATSFSVSSATTITAAAPAGTGVVHVTVITPAGTSNATVDYTYAAPAVSAVAPNHGPAGGTTPVTITGTDFTGATAVMFGTNAATSVVVVSATSITAVAPAGTGAVDVTVTTPLGTSAIVSADQYTYAPTVTGLSPNHGPAFGTNDVTITGTGFADATGVTFNEISGMGFHVSSEGKIARG